MFSLLLFKLNSLGGLSKLMPKECPHSFLQLYGVTFIESTIIYYLPVPSDEQLCFPKSFG